MPRTHALGFVVISICTALSCSDSGAGNADEDGGPGIDAFGSDASPLATCPAMNTQRGDVIRDIVYAPTHERNVLDLYLAPGTDPAPLLIWIHGGGWRGGSKDSLPRIVSDLRAYGYAVASVEYRLSDQPWPTTIQDVKAAVRWLRANAAAHNIEPSRFAALGSSAGGHLAAMLGTSSGVAALEDLGQGNPAVSDKVQAVVDYFGPSDLGNMDADLLMTSCPANSLCHSCADSPEMLLLDCPSDASTCLAGRLEEGSPVSHADTTDAPFVVVHGDTDCTVPTPQGRRMHDALINAGVESTYFEVAGAGHSLGAVSTQEVNLAVQTFLDRLLRDCQTP